MGRKTNLQICLLILGFAPLFFAFAQGSGLQAPENLEQVREVGEQALEVGKKELPDIIKNVWNENVLPIWQKMYDWFKQNVWPKIAGLFSREVELRKDIVEQELGKEVRETKKDLPKFLQGIWQLISDIIFKLRVLWNS